MTYLIGHGQRRPLHLNLLDVHKFSNFGESQSKLVSSDISAWMPAQLIHLAQLSRSLFHAEM